MRMTVNLSCDILMLNFEDLNRFYLIFFTFFFYSFLNLKHTFLKNKVKKFFFILKSKLFHIWCLIL